MKGRNFEEFCKLNIVSVSCSHIDAHKKEYIDNLREAVAIQSVSAWPEKRQEIVRMMQWVETRLKELGSTTELVDIGTQTLPDGKVIPLPPALMATLGNDPKKKTVLLYGHLDVQPALLEDGWDTPPFELVEKDEKLYGRGSTDDKGPVLCWIHALQGFRATGQEIPVNIKVYPLEISQIMIFLNLYIPHNSIFQSIRCLFSFYK